MRLERWAYIAAITEAILVVMSIALILRELDLNRDVAKAANATALTEQALLFNQTLWQDGEIADLWYNHGRDLNVGTETRRYRELITTWLIIHENFYYQHKAGLIDSEQYSGWSVDLRHTVKNHNLSVVAEDLVAVFPRGYGNHLEELRAEVN